MPSSDIAHEFDSIEDTIQAFSTLPPRSPKPSIPPLHSPLTHGAENGDFIVVLDDLSRENEGDLIIASMLEPMFSAR